MSETEFGWLADLQKSQCYTTCDWAKPAKSLDFGSDGYTASLTDFHELLQITAPDPICGVVYVRGKFPDNPEAILARSQRRDNAGSKGTFGWQIQSQPIPDPSNITGDALAHQESVLELDQRTAHGLVNFRWPYSQYELKRKREGDEVAVNHAGTCETISFVKSGTVFQVIRLKPAPEDRNPCLTIKIGGQIHFGCPCSNRLPSEDKSERTMDNIIQKPMANGFQVCCANSRYEKRLELQLFIDGKPQKVEGPFPSTPDMDISFYRKVHLQPGKPTIIVSTYTLRNESSNETILNSSAFNKVDQYLGTAKDSIQMTDRLWTACLPPNYTAIHALEFCAIARCVEQILCVASVPISSEVSQSTPLDTGPGNNELPSRLPSNVSGEDFGTALIYNIMTAQYVNLQSTFWQIRLLVKVHNYLSSRKFEKELLEPSSSLIAIRDSFLEKIRNRILKVLIWVLKANNETGILLLPIANGYNRHHEHLKRSRPCWSLRSSIRRDNSYNQAYFQSLAVWYVMLHCPDAITPTFMSSILLPELERLNNKDERDKYSGDRVSTPKNDILQWFRYHCLRLIFQYNFYTSEDGKAVDGYAASGLDREEMSNLQAQCEKFVLRLRESRSEPESTDNEEIDRLYLLGEELGFDKPQNPPSSDLAPARAKETRQRLAARKRTSQFNPGPGASVLYRTTSNAPWELSCLSHHSVLRINVEPGDSSDLAARRDNCFEFLLSDHTFMTTWDRADGSMIGKWWDLEPASVICATLIDLKSEGKLGTVKSVAEGDRRGSTVDHEVAHVSGGAQGSHGKTRLGATQGEREILRRITQLELTINAKNNNASGKLFDWVICKPAQIYHPIWQVQSLNDIPEVHKSKQKKDLSSRRKIKRYLEEQNESVDAPNWTLANIKDEIAPQDVQFLDVFDLFLSEDSKFSRQPEAKRRFSISSGRVMNGPYSSSQSRLIRPGPLSAEAIHHKDLFSRINYCLVDLGAKHRIMFAQRCCPSVVKGFIHIWHPDALDAFDNYFGNVSRFGETREAMWTTSITISHWSIVNTNRPGLSPELERRFKEGKSRKKADFPPSTVSKGGLLGQILLAGNSATHIVEERCSSLVITGDVYGYFWTCSLWSSITDRQSVAACIDTILPVLQRFIHQPASGRCLVFIILLGHLCENLAGEYRNILSRLDTIVELGDQALLGGLEWEAANADEKLRKQIWGLEALRIFGDRLLSASTQIQRACESLQYTIKQEASQQHIDLLEEYNNVMEVFGKRYNLVVGVQLHFKSKIIQLTGLRDGMSTIASVENSRAALRDSGITIKQGNNIRMLTLITIAYLPLSYVTSLFSINHEILPDSAGTGLYVGLIIAFVTVTYGVALSLEWLLDTLVEPVWAKFMNLFPQPLPNSSLHPAPSDDQARLTRRNSTWHSQTV